MKIDTTQALFAGSQPMMEPGGSVPITMRTLLVTALGYMQPGRDGAPEDMRAEDKVRCGRLAIDALSDEVDWPISDVALALDRIKARHEPILVYLAVQMLDPDTARG